MKLLIIYLLLFSLPSLAWETYEVSGNAEAQGRYSKNNPLAQKDLFQDWETSDFYLLYGNLNGKLTFKESRLETNCFMRLSTSELYTPDPTPLGPREPYLATRIFTFPQKLVARDIFNLQFKDRQETFQYESVLNKLTYEYDIRYHRLTLGRMYINYGLGEIFNPINPFNQPTGLTAISQVAQGNDGVGFNYKYSRKLSLDFYALGDKTIEGDNGKIDQTFWTHGEYQATQKLQLDFVLGEDQNRRKMGGQLSYNTDQALVFIQMLYQTKLINNTPSNTLVDALLGYDRQLTAKWHLRFEGGYQEKNQFLSFNSVGERFLPTEYFIALANQYELHPLIKVTGTIINDLKSGFTYFITKNTLDLGHDMEMEVFGFLPLARGDAADNEAQKLVTTDVGMALRAFF